MKTLARQRDKAEILGRLKTVRPDSARRWGQMSAHQMICHLSDAFRMGMGQKPVSRADGLLQRTMLKWVVLYLPVAWPRGILTRPEIDQALGGTRPVDFASDVARLESLLELVTAQPRSFNWQSHPLFGGMSDAAWLRWGTSTWTTTFASLVPETRITRILRITRIKLQFGLLGSFG